ncbi:hypothetical protein [Pseudonocardia halophobica]|uniref:hypothetical protein n=1 Tax=Pseudonocardia halophobica TaxID=29401 RepID=UPI0031DE1116
MRRSVQAGLILSAIFTSTIGTTAVAAAAVPAAAGDHNCAGAAVSSMAGPGFGSGVSSLAHQQLVDNIGLADCRQPPRQNP